MKSRESGQTLVVILLVVATSLLVGAGVATRSTSLIQQTTFSEESTQALHFAEGCAEEALGMIKDENITQGDVESDSVSYCCDIDGGTGCEEIDSCDKDVHDCEFSVETYEDLFVGIVDQDDVVQIDLENMSDCSALGLYWCLDTENCNDYLSENHGLEVSIIYEDGAETKVWKEVYGDTHTHSFTSPDGGGDVGDETYNYSKKIEFADLPVAAGNLKAVRLTPRFEGFHIKVKEEDGGTNCDLGFQGFDINTSGWYGRSTRKVRVTRGEPAMPPIFDYSVFSGSEDEPLQKD